MAAKRGHPISPWTGAVFLGLFLLPRGAWVGWSLVLVVLALLCLAAAALAQRMSDGNDAINAASKWEGPRVRALTGVEPLAEVRELSAGARYLVTVPAGKFDAQAIEKAAAQLDECFKRMFPDGLPGGCRFLLAPDDFVFYEIVEGED